MERKISKVLSDWKKSTNRLPLILQGARQVGKTFSLLQFGKANYRNIAYCNFESSTELHTLFEQSLSPSRLIPQIGLLTNSQILEEESLIIFDEVQTCERALTSLKYFAEEAPSYNIIAAGSLLGVVLNRQKFSFPVGKVRIETMYPMDFEEFLWALNKQEATKFIAESFQNHQECPIHNHLLDLFKIYLSLGGMPRVIREYTESGDPNMIHSIKEDLLSGYVADMAKYAGTAETISIMAAYESIPAQLAKQNRKFQYNIIKSGARAKNYESAIEWLTASGVVVKVKKCPYPRLPLSAFAPGDHFKLYLNDTGFLCSRYGLNNSSLLIEPLQITGIKGVLAENYVASALKSSGFELFYWESEGKAEIDFLIQDYQGNIIPLVVKSSENIRSKSLSQYISRYQPVAAYKISTKNFGKEGILTSIPIYASYCLTNK